MSLVPRSLFSRLVLVLLAGLFTAQLASLAIHLHERGELIARETGRQAAQRIADIVKLLDTLPPAERRRIAQVISAPPMTISFDRAALAPQDEDSENGPRAARFGAVLRRLLADDRPVTVNVTAAPAVAFAPGAMRGFMGGEFRGEGPPPWAGMHAGTPAGLSFVAQVHLRDGTRVTFDSRQSTLTENWPVRLLASVAILLVAVIAVSLVAVRWATRPLKALADAADELGRNLNRPPMEEKGPLEVARAARAFNTMQSRLAGYIRDRTRVLAAMSHDLKTPITRLRLRAELLDDDQAKARFGRDLDEMEAMVRDTLDFLGGMENGESVRPVDVGALLESIQADWRELGGSVEIESAAVKPYPGRPQALKRCLANLIENAVKYGKTARIAMNDSAARLEILVRDEGPGLPQGELNRVFEPFYRVEASRSRETGGTGLGLTIARSVAEAHGGSVVLRNRPEGGLEADLVLPRPSV
jgi:signal transduction histidine kinase